MSGSLLTQPEASNKPEGEGQVKPTDGDSESTSEEQSKDGEGEGGEETPPSDDSEGGEGEAESQDDEVPLDYELKVPKDLPEGHEFDSQVIETYTEVAKELKLSKEGAQKMLDVVSQKLYDRAAQLQTETYAQWAKDTEKHEELNAGDGFKANLKIAQQAINKFGSDGLKTLLDGALGNHPELVAFAYRVGKAIQPDKFEGGKGGKGKPKADPNDPESIADSFYDNPTSKIG